MSLTVEGAFDAAALAVNCRTALRKMAAVLLPCALLLALFAPFWLGLFGPAYAAHGTGSSRFWPPQRCAGHRPSSTLGVFGPRAGPRWSPWSRPLRATLTLGLTVALTGAMGTVGAAVAVATSQAFAAVLIAPASGAFCGQTTAGDRHHRWG